MSKTISLNNNDFVETLRIQLSDYLCADGVIVKSDITIDSIIDGILDTIELSLDIQNMIDEAVDDFVEKK